MQYSEELSITATGRACWVSDNWEAVRAWYLLDGRHIRSKDTGADAENITHGLDSIDSLKAWINSPKHNKVLIGDYTEYGLGSCGEIKVLLTEKT